MAASYLPHTFLNKESGVEQLLSCAINTTALENCDDFGELFAWDVSCHGSASCALHKHESEHYLYKQ